MIHKLSCFIKVSLCDLKRSFSDCKIHLLICTVALIIGLLMALGKDYSNVNNCNNFIIVIIGGNTSPVPQFLRLIIWFVVVFLLIFATSFHFFAYLLLGYGGICLASYIVFSNAFKAIAVNTFLGIMHLVFYTFPTVIVVFFGVILALKKIYHIVNYNCYRKCMINVPCHFNSIKSAITPILLLSFAIALVYWLIFYLVLLLFV